MLPDHQTLLEEHPLTLEQSLLIRRMELLAEQQGTDPEVIELLLGTIEYYQLRENWCMKQLQKQWGL